MTWTSVEQSEKLLELGVPKETADLWYDIITPCQVKINSSGFSELVETGEPYCTISLFNPDSSTQVDQNHHKVIPAWSTEALLNLMPRYIECKKGGYKVKYWLNFSHHYAAYANQAAFISLHSEMYSTALDTYYHMVLWLIENNHMLINKK